MADSALQYLAAETELNGFLALIYNTFTANRMWIDERRTSSSATLTPGGIGNLVRLRPNPLCRVWNRCCVEHVAYESLSGFDETFSAGGVSLPCRMCDENAATAAGDILLLFITALALAFPLPTGIDFTNDVVSAALGSFGGGGGGGCNRI